MQALTMWSSCKTMRCDQVPVRLGIPGVRQSVSQPAGSHSCADAWLRSDPKPPPPSMHVPLQGALQLSAARREANAPRGYGVILASLLFPFRCCRLPIGCT
jgi:hypothetical protein